MATEKKVVDILYDGFFGILNYFAYLCTAFFERAFFHLLNSIKRRFQYRANRAFHTGHGGKNDVS